MSAIDESRSFIPVNIAVMTISDTRKLSDDKSGDLLVQRLDDAGHKLAARVIICDEVAEITAQLSHYIDDEAIDCVDQLLSFQEFFHLDILILLFF